MPAEDIRHPEKQPNSSKGGRKKYKRQKKRQKRTTLLKSKKKIRTICFFCLYGWHLDNVLKNN